MNKIRIIMAKPGLDGHDRGIKILARAFRDSGMEVIYLGLRQTPEMIVNAAIQEDVDVVGLSFLSGAHMELVPLITAGLEERGMGHTLVVLGGIIPDDDQSSLKAIGVDEIFGPGSTTEAMIEYLLAEVASRRGRSLT